METRNIVPDRVWTIDSFLTLLECAQFIELREQNGYEQATINTKSGAVLDTKVRNNDRVIFDGEELSRTLWQRAAPLVPSTLWNRTSIGLNERFRFYRYDVGQTFKPHFDGSVKRENGEKSQLTFLMYLNDEAQGGETRFYLRPPLGDVTIKPALGTALVFLHNLLHEGAPVTAGRKYVLRSDVMYSALVSSSG
jgi:predicted 2-oxoglutarate/Fe(II)-dependent dioxygenase YbiX